MDIPEVVREFIEDLYSPTDSLEEMGKKLTGLLESQEEDEQELECSNCSSSVSFNNSIYCNDCYEQNGDCNGECAYVENIREEIGRALDILKNA